MTTSAGGLVGGVLAGRGRRLRHVGVVAFGVLCCLAAGARPVRADSAPAVRIGQAAADGAAADGAASDTAPTTPAEAANIAKKLQNPIGDLISFPVQSNTNFGYGPGNGTQEIVNVQPVVPIHLDARWTLIVRTVLPMVWQPSLQPAPTVPFGTGPITVSAFLAPANPVNGWLWGVGPVVQVPTASDASLGSSVWGGGVTGVLVFMKGPWVAGALANNIWSLGGSSGPQGNRYETFLLQPFVNYNFGNGWYVGTSPVITANWRMRGDHAWTLPIGGQAGRVIKLGKLPVNLLLGAYYNVLRPSQGPNWQIRSQVTLVF
jgi:hypothetical protein